MTVSAVRTPKPALRTLSSTGLGPSEVCGVLFLEGLGDDGVFTEKRLSHRLSFPLDGTEVKGDHVVGVSAPLAAPSQQKRSPQGCIPIC